ncbi:MAG: winged helix-turn-helix domain-containing protein [Planctomycetes bacterium]|nr:winged helix-turn-helix domain-containing protein [Planctomycetota bacterium]
MATKKTTKKKAPSKTRTRAKTDAIANQKNARQDAQRSTTKGGKAVVKSARRSVLDGAATILANASTPMSCGEMIDAILKRKLWTTQGKTPAATLSSAILREIQRKGKESRFVKAERGRFRRSKSA